MTMGINMGRVAKSRFKPRALEYFRQVERTRKPLIITDRGTPVLKIIPYSEDRGSLLEALRGTVLGYERPTEPVALEDWKALE
jgi:prevent-host-death family protein